MISAMFARRIPLIMGAIKRPILDSGKGLVPYLIENKYLPKEAPFLFHDVDTLQALDRFQNAWMNRDKYNLAQALIQFRILGGVVPKGIWQYKDECQWVVEQGIMEERDISFWVKNDGSIQTISELSGDDILYILNTGKDTEDNIRQLLLTELVERGQQTLDRRIK